MTQQVNLPTIQRGETIFHHNGKYEAVQRVQSLLTSPLGSLFAVQKIVHMGDPINPIEAAATMPIGASIKELLGDPFLSEVDYNQEVASRILELEGRFQRVSLFIGTLARQQHSDELVLNHIALPTHLPLRLPLAEESYHTWSIRSVTI
jgi:hypothetical protein